MPITRLQRQFIGWHARQRFAVPIRLGRRTHERLEIEFTGLPLFGGLGLHRDDISIYVRHPAGWDLLFASYAPVIRRSPDGWRCARIDAGPCSTKAALFNEVMFRPFVTWLAELALATAIAVPARTSYRPARLIRDEPIEADEVLVGLDP